MTSILSLGLLGLLASPASGFWRLPCKDTLVVERADPIVNPGKVSGHLHQIMGGNAFDFDMTYEDTQASTCTSCTVHGDFSNYWTPVLYHKSKDGKFTKVKQVGGGLVYYLQRKGDSNEKLKAFPEGFRMLAGDPFKRTGGTDFPSQAVNYNCLDYNGPAKPETNGFPNYNCPNGLRSQLFFPSCWDGKNLDSADHKSHMSYPLGNYNGGKCPDTHPVHLISIFYEIIWDTNAFKDQWDGGNQPFVWSMGDPTGYGFHGDFLNGWDVDLLQRAVDECTNDSGRVEDCPVFQLYADNAASGCKIGSKVDEEIQGPLSALPGCNPMQNGPNRAQPGTNCAGNITSTVGAAKTFFKDLTSKGWGYQGCGTDNFYNRQFTGASTSNDKMTNSACIDFCSSKGFSVAASEYGRECYCANNIPSAAAPIAGSIGGCNMACAGDGSDFCGGAAAVSIYKKCSGSSCSNAQVGGSQKSSGDSSTPVNSGGNTSNDSGSKTSSAAPAKSSVSTQNNNNGNNNNDGNSGTGTSSNNDVSYSNPGDDSGYSMPSSSKVQPATPATSSAAASKSTARSKPSASSSSSSSSGNKSSPANIKLPSGWTYQSCVTDNVRPRSLEKLAPYTIGSSLVTSSSCVAWCDAQGFSIAGTEYAGECFCGNQLSQSSQADESKCNMPCKGDKSQLCGGKGTMNLYKKASISSSSSNSTTPRTRFSGKRDEHLHSHLVKARRFPRGAAGLS